VVVGIEAGLKHDSAINLDHIQPVHKEQLRQFLGTVSPETLAQVCRALAVATGCGR
jgi:mRNA-degrading endonuclease toxin of MazEF toxin-antitoxin module